MTPNYLVICGGGVRGVAITGALDMLVKILCGKEKHTTRTQGALKPNNFYKTLKGGGGTSIGALITFSILAGIDQRTLCKIIKSSKTWDAIKVIETMDISNITHSGGFCTHECLYDLVDEIFDLLDLPHDMTFAEFNASTKKYFLCNSSCIDDNKIYLMDHRRTPNMQIRMGLVMSMCIPVLFKPFSHQGKLYVDGGFFRNYLLAHFPPTETIGIRIKDNMSEPLPFKNNELFTAVFIYRLLLCQSKTLDNEHWESLDPLYRYNTINVITPTVQPMTIGVTTDTLEQLYRNGQWSVLWFFFKDIVVGSLLGQMIDRMEKSNNENLFPLVHDNKTNNEQNDQQE